MSKTIDKAGSLFLRAVLLRMKELGLNKTALAARMKAARPYVTKVLKGDVSVTLRSASRFARALEMDFLPTLTPRTASAAPKGGAARTRPHFAKCGPDETDAEGLA